MIRYFAVHPTAANLLMALLILVGVVSAPGLLRETFPRIAPREVQIAIAYPGAAPEEVSRAICGPVEDALDAVEAVDEIRCEAFENRAVIVAAMLQGRDFGRFTADVEVEIDAIDDLPDAAEDPIIRQLGRVDPVAVLAITAEGGHPAIELKALAEELRVRMLRWGGIPRVEVAGFSEPQIRIEIADVAARQLGLSLEEIARTVGRQNVDLPLGELVSDQGSTLLRFTDERRALDAFQDVVIASSRSGAEIRLGDVAHIFETFDKREVRTELNGRSAAVLRITKTHSDDTLRVMEALNAFLEQERPRLPPGVVIAVTGDASEVLRERLNMVAVNGVQGLLLVVGAIWLFFGLRQAIWIGMGLPVSFLGAIAMMTLLGYSINMLTLVGLLIVIGIVMDDSIVITENIETKRAAGLPPLEAAIQGTAEVAPGVAASFVTTAAVFGSLAFLEGNLGELMRVIPVVMLLVLIVSLVEAFLILPAHLSHGAPEAPEPPRRADRWLDAVRRRVVGPLVRKAVAWRWLTLGIAFLAFFASIAAIAGGALKFQAFPEIDGDQIEARIELPAGAALEETEAAVAHVLAGLSRANAELSPRNPDGAPLVRDVVVIYGENDDAGGAGAHLATVTADLLAAETRGADIDTILASWRREAPPTPAMRRLNLTEPALGPAGRAIELRLAHDDPGVLASASAELRNWLTGYAGAYNVADDLAPGRPELRLTLRDGAGGLGLDARAVADQVRAAFQGVSADEVQAGAESWEIDVRLAEDDRDSPADLEDFALLTPAGARVPLSAVALIEEGRGYAAIRRIDGRRTVTVTGDVDPALGNADEIVRDTAERFLPDLMARHPGLEAGTEGQNAAAAETQASMAAGLAIGLLLVYLMLSLQFRSYAEPIVVMVIIPFALIGAVAAHLALGIDMSMPSLLGVASLSGIVVNDSILLVEVIKQRLEDEGEDIAVSAPAAAEARFRAILLTSVTTIAGLVPLLAETSLQAQVLVPLVASIAGGLTATTLLVLFVAPAFYAALHELGLSSAGRREVSSARGIETGASSHPSKPG